MWIDRLLQQQLRWSKESLDSLRVRIWSERESCAQEGMPTPRDVQHRRAENLRQAELRLAQLQRRAMNQLKQPFPGSDE